MTANKTANVFECVCESGYVGTRCHIGKASMFTNRNDEVTE